MVSPSARATPAEKLLPKVWKKVFEEEAMQSIFSLNESSYFVCPNRETEQPRTRTSDPGNSDTSKLNSFQLFLSP